MFIDVLTSFLSRIDLVSELSGLRPSGPVHMRAYELQVPIVWAPAGVKNLDPLADVLENLTIKRRIADCQCRCVQPVLFVFSQKRGGLHRRISRPCDARAGREGRSGQTNRQCDCYRCSHSVTSRHNSPFFP